MLCLQACVSCLCAYCTQKSGECWMVVSHHVGARNSPQEEQVSTAACTIFPTPNYKFLLLVCSGGDKDWVSASCMQSRHTAFSRTLRYFYSKKAHTSIKILPMIQSSQAQYCYIQERNWLLFNKWCWETWMLTCKSELHPHYMQKFIQAKKELSYKILPQRHMNKPSLCGIW